jgi:hypothetical protein
MLSEEIACLCFGILGRRFVVFHPIVVKTNPRLQYRYITAVMDARVDSERDRRATGP